MQVSLGVFGVGELVGFHFFLLRFLLTLSLFILQKVFIFILAEMVSNTLSLFSKMYSLSLFLCSLQPYTAVASSEVVALSISRHDFLLHIPPKTIAQFEHFIKS